MINRLLSILPALAFALLAQSTQAQSPPQPQSQSKPQAQPPAKSQQPSQAPQQQAQGGFLYKSTMPDGKVLYGDAPIPGAVKVEKSKPDTSKRGITAATPSEMAAAKNAGAGRAATGADLTPAERTRQLEEALRRLQAERDKGAEPLEGERIGTAGGGSRLTESYQERQKKLDQAIDVVRKELDKARAAR